MINIKNLSFAYRHENFVLSDVNTELRKGHIYGLLGKNGVGKSTLLKLICGLIFPTKGDVITLGEEPRRRNPSLLSEVFFITEDIEAPKMGMRKFAQITAPFYPNFNHSQLEHYMKEFEVDMDTPINSFSHGQQKKAVISFALACNTKILLMDEPTNGLDIPSKSQFRRIIASIATPERCVIISTHQVRDLDTLIDAVLVMNHKELIINSSIENISKKLTFGAVESLDNPIYVERSIRGDWGITPNTTETDSKVDIEMFFNATMENPERMSQLMK